MTQQPTISYVIDLAKRAGQMILDAGNKTKHINEKASYSDVVTETDVAVEKYLISQIKKDFADHTFFCEETTSHEVFTDAPTWLIDPIDGTTNFVHTHPDHCVSIGYAYHGKVLLGVIYIPHRNELFSAERGKGAFLNGQRINVSSPPKPLHQCLVATGFLVGFLHDSKADSSARAQFRDVMLQNFTALLDKAQDIRRSGSAATDLSLVASGRVDAYAEIGIRAYDYGAGSILVEEAGGIVLGYDGEPIKIGSRHCVAASNLKLGKEIATLLKKSPLEDNQF